LSTKQKKVSKTKSETSAMTANPKKAVTKKAVTKKASSKKAAAKKVVAKKDSSSTTIRKTATVAKKAKKLEATVSKTKSSKKAAPKKAVTPKVSIVKKDTRPNKVVAAEQPISSEKGKKESVISKLARSSAEAKSEAITKKSLAEQISVTREVTSPGGVVHEQVARVAKVEDFKIGDKVVYPGHGVGEITSFRAKSIGGTEQRIFDITMLESGMKIMVPVVQAQAVGLRKVVDKKAIDEVYTILKMRDCKIDTQTWNRRFREYTQKIKTGSVFEIAEVLRDLTVLSVEKELSFGEKKMLDTAQALLVSEISIAKSKPQERVMGDLQEIFS